MKVKKGIFHYLLAILGLLLFTSCGNTQDAGVSVDYVFKTAIDVSQGPDDFEQIEFNGPENLDLGFYRGTVWVKLDITNSSEYESFVVTMNDLINRSYRFYKLDTVSHSLLTVTKNVNTDFDDHRTFNNSKPNFKLSLAPYEKATFFFTTSSDGRILQATPSLLSLDEYKSIIQRSTTFNLIYYAAIAVLLLINIFHWSLLRNSIYYFYAFYILSSCFFYLFVEGELYGLGLAIPTVDHLMFLSIRVWILSVVLFTARFLELGLTRPKFYRYLKIVMIAFLGCTTFYQLAFYNTSISFLHKAENLFGFMWVVVVIVMIAMSIKQRSLQARYYMVAYSFLIAFVAMGLIDSHTTILPGDPFSYFKIGTITEFAGFTYFIAFLIRGNVLRSAELENELEQKRKEVSALTTLLEEKFGDLPIDTTTEADPNIAEAAEEPRSKVTLSDEEMAQIETIILRELDDKRHYTNSDLSLSKLAELVNIPAYKISITINQKMNTTFYDLINSKRVEASLSLLRDNKNLTIEAITAQVGFKSKSTFYRAFKKYKGTTPTDFLSKG